MRQVTSYTMTPEELKAYLEKNPVKPCTDEKLMKKIRNKAQYDPNKTKRMTW